jgi:hypothetical protein
VARWSHRRHVRARAERARRERDDHGVLERAGILHPVSGTAVAPSVTSPSHPRCHHDAATHTWFAVVLFINSSNTVSRIDLAVNTSGDPTKVWTSYRIDTTDIGGQTGPKHPGCPCLGDQPTLGIDAYNVYVTTNDFSLQGPQFNGAQIYAIAKSDLVAPGPPSTPAHFVHFDKLNVGGTVAASVQPSLTARATPAEFFMNSLDPDGTFDERVGVWALTNRAAVATGGKPTLSSVAIPSEAHGVPPGAEQPGGLSLLNAGDDRMQQVQSIGGEIWGALDTSVAAARWGDYSWAVLDPSGKSVWLATEYMPPKPSQTTDGLRNWGTRVFEVAAR